MRRARRYKGAIIVGALLTAAGFSLSLWTMYYASPRMTRGKQLSLHVEGGTVVLLPLEGATSEKVYYVINLTSTAPLQLALSFLSNGTEVGYAYLGSRTAYHERGSLTLLSAPEEALIILNCSYCEVGGSVVIRYSSINIRYLMLLNALLTAASFGGVALLLYGAYNYALLKYTPPRKLELRKE